MDSDLFAFQPDPGRAQAVDARVRAGLADSLAAVFKALGDSAPGKGDDLVARVRAEPVWPVVFGIYTDLVEAIFGNDIDRAVKLAGELCAIGFDRVDAFRIVTLRDDLLGNGQVKRYCRLVNDDPEFEFDLEALAPATLAAATTRVNEALALIDAANPQLAGEIRNLVRQVVLVESSDAEFGATSFQLWGALFLRLKEEAGRVEIAESLAHESGHALLFGLGMGKPLVNNPAQARYKSPLRDDPRPMDGVVHAAYVISRMHYTATCLLESGLLTSQEERVALEACAQHVARYAEGWELIGRHAELTPVGEAALASANAYMSSAAAAREVI